MPGTLGPDIRLRLTFEHAPSELVQASPKGVAPPVDAPRSIRIELLENRGWAVRASCDDDLKVPLAVNADGTSAFPRDVWASCTVVLKRKNGDITVAPWMEVHGAGTVTVSTATPEEKLTEESP